MSDHLSPSKRSWNMGRIHSTNTKPELVIRSLLHRKGFRFSVHKKVLPGTPDIVLRKYKTVVFINGCFWHRHKGCKRATLPQTNREKWLKKFNQNIERDISNKNSLTEMGWKVITVWECEIKKEPEKVVQNIVEKLLSAKRAT